MRNCVFKWKVSKRLINPLHLLMTLFRQDMITYKLNPEGINPCPLPPPRSRRQLLSQLSPLPDFLFFLLSGTWHIMGLGVCWCPILSSFQIYNHAMLMLFLSFLVYQAHIFHHSDTSIDSGIHIWHSYDFPISFHQIIILYAKLTFLNLSGI